MLNYTKLGLKKIQISNTHGGQYKSDTPESRGKNMALTRTFVFRFDSSGTLFRQSRYNGSPRAASRLARGVLIAIGIALCSASPAGNAQPMPQKTPFAYSSSMIGDIQTECLFRIALKESNIRFTAINKTSGAYGAFQLLHKVAKGADPYKQVELAIEYANYRYGSPCKAWDFWKRNYWW